MKAIYKLIEAMLVKMGFEVSIWKPESFRVLL